MIITPDIISVLSLLRSHIAALTRDNEALRHTFLGTRTGSSSKLTQETSRITDLEDVVSRVKELIQENEELGEMVLEAGKEGVEEYQRALEGGLVLGPADNRRQSSDHFPRVGYR